MGSLLEVAANSEMLVDSWFLTYRSRWSPILGVVVALGGGEQLVNSLEGGQRS